MKMRYLIKPFSDLTTTELYHILQLRAEVFVVEQQCSYQDLDGKDPLADHLMFYEDKKLIGYTRLFKPREKSMASIGRVIIHASFRKQNFGKQLMQQSIHHLNTTYGAEYIELSAQTYLLNFYNNLGFIEEGVEYVEDGIPHIKMVWKKAQ